VEGRVEEVGKQKKGLTRPGEGVGKDESIEKKTASTRGIKGLRTM